MQVVYQEGISGNISWGVSEGDKKGRKSVTDASSSGSPPWATGTYSHWAPQGESTDLSFMPAEGRGRWGLSPSSCGSRGMLLQAASLTSRLCCPQRTLRESHRTGCWQWGCWQGVVYARVCGQEHQQHLVPWWAHMNVSVREGKCMHGGRPPGCACMCVEGGMPGARELGDSVCRVHRGLSNTAASGHFRTKEGARGWEGVLQGTERELRPLRGDEGQRHPTRGRVLGRVPDSRPRPACRSSPCGSARTTTGSPASRRGSRCLGRSRPSPRPRPSAPSCRGASL